MTPEKNNALCSKYPAIFPKDFWIECDDGWYDLLDTLCACIQNEVKKNIGACPPDDIEQHQVVVLQVKSKFAGLRFYVESCSETISGMIRHAESMSYRICEQCGNRGHRRQAGRGWIFTSCDPCWLIIQSKLTSACTT